MTSIWFVGMSSFLPWYGLRPVSKSSGRFSHATRINTCSVSKARTSHTRAFHCAARSIFGSSESSSCLMRMHCPIAMLSDPTASPVSCLDLLRGHTAVANPTCELFVPSQRLPFLSRPHFVLYAQSILKKIALQLHPRVPLSFPRRRICRDGEGFVLVV